MVAIFAQITLAAIHSAVFAVRLLAAFWTIHHTLPRYPNVPKLIHYLYLFSNTEDLITADGSLQKRREQLTQAEGIGEITALVPQRVSALIALLPELGRLSKKQISALVGVAPF